MKDPVRILTKIPSELYLPAKEEVLQIDWNHLPFPDRRSETSIFKTSTANHLRVHKVEKDTPHTIAALSAIIECVDTKARALYPRLNDLGNWIYNYVKGEHLGRIMIVKLKAGGKIATHIDPGKYFEAHYRFHIPFITNTQVLFSGPEGSTPIHMPAGHLCQLLNRNPHGAENNSDHDRIHMIIDISSRDSSFLY